MKNKVSYFLAVDLTDPNIINPEKLSLPIQKPCQYYDDWVRDILEGDFELLVQGKVYNKDSLEKFYTYTSLLPLKKAQILALRIASGDKATFIHAGQPYIILLMQAPFANNVCLLTDLSQPDFDNLQMHLPQNKLSSLVLMGLNLSSQNERTRPEVALPDQPVDHSSNTLFFHYHADIGSYEYLKKYISENNDIEVCFIEIGERSQKLFDLFNATGNTELLQLVLSLATVTRSRSSHDPLISLAQVCYLNKVKMVSVDDLSSADHQFTIDNRKLFISSRNRFIAAKICDYISKNKIKCFTGLFGATHYEVARLVNTTSCFLSPRLSSPNLEPIVLAPEFYGKFSSSQIADYLRQQYRQFSKVIITESIYPKENTSASKYLRYGGFFALSLGGAVASAIIYTYLNQEPSHDVQEYLSP